MNNIRSFYFKNMLKNILLLFLIICGSIILDYYIPHFNKFFFTFLITGLVFLVIENFSYLRKLRNKIKCICEKENININDYYLVINKNIFFLVKNDNSKKIEFQL